MKGPLDKITTSRKQWAVTMDDARPWLPVSGMKMWDRASGQDNGCVKRLCFITFLTSLSTSTYAWNIQKRGKQKRNFMRDEFSDVSIRRWSRLQLIKVRAIAWSEIRTRTAINGVTRGRIAVFVILIKKQYIIMITISHMNNILEHY